ncbi:MAG TPA: hypothetical protein VHO48_00860 [Anaerolineaceae bacterium]|nr:hypothetical protein [Anaerolineaceae bacterium]
MNDPIQDTIQRTQRYWYIDGVSEIAIGVVILVMALFYLVIGLLDPGSVSAFIVGIGQPVIILIGWWFSGKAVRAVKERLTYPRTGYVAYRSEKAKRKVSRFLISCLIAAGTIVLLTLVTSRISQYLLPTISAAVICAAVLFSGYRFGLTRFYLLGIYTLLAGILTSWLQLSDSFSSALFFGLFALGWIVSGGLTLIHYLRSTQPIDLEVA